MLLGVDPGRGIVPGRAGVPSSMPSVGSFFPRCLSSILLSDRRDEPGDVAVSLRGAFLAGNSRKEMQRGGIIVLCQEGGLGSAKRNGTAQHPHSHGSDSFLHALKAPANDTASCKPFTSRVPTFLRLLLPSARPDDRALLLPGVALCSIQ